MTESAPKTLREHFSRTLKRQRLKCTRIRGRFLTAAADGELEKVKEIVDLFPEAVHWTRGQDSGVWEDVTPLTNALWSRNRNRSCVPLIHFLVDHGADVNGQTSTGYSALLKAVNMVDLEAIETLILRGADPDLKNKEGVSPRDEAKKIAEREHDMYDSTKPSPDVRPIIEAAMKKLNDTAIASCTGGTPGTIRKLPVLRFKKRR